VNSTIIRALYFATQLAKESPLSIKHGAVALRKNKVVGFGTNSKRTNWLQRIFAKKVGEQMRVEEHAEFAAMRGASIVDTLIVVRVWEDTLKNSKPCPVCREMIEASGIKHLYYSNKFGGIEYERIT
jgi:tRNA(Arg) A34 adenosine deaminase TadA